jgi:hypothetical protein
MAQPQGLTALSAFGHMHPLVILSSGNPVVDSVSASPLGPVAPVMPPIRRGLTSSEEDSLSSRAADAYPKPTRAAALLLVPDSELDRAVQTDLLAGSTDQYISVGGRGQAHQDPNQRACEETPSGRVESQCATSLGPSLDAVIQHQSPSDQPDLADALANHSARSRTV